MKGSEVDVVIEELVVVMMKRYIGIRREHVFLGFGVCVCICRIIQQNIYFFYFFSFERTKTSKFELAISKAHATDRIGVIWWIPV